MPIPATPLPDDVLARIRGLAATQGGVFRVGQALDCGATPAQVVTQVRRQAWATVCHGVLAKRTWATGLPPHALACAALLLVTRRDAVVSHASAGVLHGLSYVVPPARPTLTVPRTGAVRHLEALHSSRVPAAHRQQLGGLPVTTPARTVVDLLRTQPGRGAAQAIADGALATGVERDALESVLASCGRWPGVEQAREALRWADGRRESPLESRCVVWFRDGALPEPEPQVLLGAWDGFRARVDFFFRLQRTVVEADGRLKYDDPAALWAEKRREDRLRDLGLEVVRATWADGEDGGADLVRRIQRAFARAARRAA